MQNYTLRIQYSDPFHLWDSLSTFIEKHSNLSTIQFNSPDKCLFTLPKVPITYVPSPNLLESNDSDGRDLPRDVLETWTSLNCSTKSCSDSLEDCQCMIEPILPLRIFLVELESYDHFRKNSEQILLDWLQLLSLKNEDWFVLFSIKLSYISRNDKFYKKILDKIKNKIAVQSEIPLDKEDKNFLLVPNSNQYLTQKESLLFQYYWNSFHERLQSGVCKGVKKLYTTMYNHFNRQKDQLDRILSLRENKKTTSEGVTVLNSSCSASKKFSTKSFFFFFEFLLSLRMQCHNFNDANDFFLKHYPKLNAALSYDKVKSVPCETNISAFAFNFLSLSVLFKQATTCSFFFHTKSLLECRCYLFSRQLNLFLQLKKETAAFCLCYVFTRSLMLEMRREWIQSLAQTRVSHKLDRFPYYMLWLFFVITNLLKGLITVSYSTLFNFELIKSQKNIALEPLSITLPCQNMTVKEEVALRQCLLLSLTALSLWRQLMFYRAAENWAIVIKCPTTTEPSFSPLFPESDLSNSFEEIHLKDLIVYLESYQKAAIVDVQLSSFIVQITHYAKYDRLLSVTIYSLAHWTLLLKKQRMPPQIHLLPQNFNNRDLTLATAQSLLSQCIPLLEKQMWVRLWISFEATLCEIYNSLNFLQDYISSCYRLSHFHVDLLASHLSSNPLPSMTPTPLFVATCLNCRRSHPNKVYKAEVLSWVESNYSIPSHQCTFFLEFSLLGCFFSITYFELFKQHSQKCFAESLRNELLYGQVTKNSCISPKSQDSSICFFPPFSTKQNTKTIQPNASACFQLPSSFKPSFDKTILQLELNNCQQKSACVFNFKKKQIFNLFPMIYISKKITDEEKTVNGKFDATKDKSEFCSLKTLRQPNMIFFLSENEQNECIFDWSPLTLLKIPIIPSIGSFSELNFSILPSNLYMIERDQCNNSAREQPTSSVDKSPIGASVSGVPDFSDSLIEKNSCYYEDANQKRRREYNLIVNPPRNALFKFSFMKHKTHSKTRKSKSSNFGFSALHSRKLSSHWKRFNTNLLKPHKTNFSKHFQLPSLHTSEDIDDLTNSEDETNFSQCYSETVILDHNHEGHLEGSPETIMKAQSTPSSKGSFRTNFSIGASSEPSTLVNGSCSTAHGKKNSSGLRTSFTIITDKDNYDETKQLFKKDIFSSKNTEESLRFPGLQSILESILLQTSKHDINAYKENKNADVFIDVGQNFKIEINFFSWFPSHLTIDYFVLKFICHEDKKRSFSPTSFFAQNIKGTLQHPHFPLDNFNIAQTGVVENESTVALYLILYPKRHLQLHSGYSRLLITGRATTVGAFFLTDLYATTGECILEHSFTTKPPYNCVRDLALCRLYHEGDENISEMFSIPEHLKNAIYNLNINFRQLFQKKSFNHFNEITCMNIQPPSTLHKAFHISITNIAPGCHSKNQVANYLINFLDVKLTRLQHYVDIQKMELSILKNDSIANQTDFVVCWNASCIIEYDHNKITDTTEFCQLSFTDDMAHWIQLPFFREYCRILLPIIPCIQKLTDSSLCWGISSCPCQNGDDTLQSSFFKEKKLENATSLGILSRRSEGFLTKNTSKTVLESLNTTPILSCHTLMTEANIFSMQTLDFRFTDDTVNKVLSISSSHNVQHQKFPENCIPFSSTTSNIYVADKHIPINSSHSTNIQSETVDAFFCTEKTKKISFNFQPILRCCFINEKKEILHNSFSKNIPLGVVVNKDVDTNKSTTFPPVVPNNEKKACSSVALDDIFLNDFFFRKHFKKSVSDSCLCQKPSFSKEFSTKTNLSRKQISCLSSDETSLPTLKQSVWYTAKLENFTFHPYNLTKPSIYRQSQLRCNTVSCNVQIGCTPTKEHFQSQRLEVCDHSSVLLKSIDIEDPSFNVNTPTLVFTEDKTSHGITIHSIKEPHKVIPLNIPLYHGQKYSVIVKQPECGMSLKNNLIMKLSFPESDLTCCTSFLNRLRHILQIFNKEFNSFAEQMDFFYRLPQESKKNNECQYISEIHVFFKLEKFNQFSSMQVWIDLSLNIVTTTIHVPIPLEVEYKNKTSKNICIVCEAISHPFQNYETNLWNIKFPKDCLSVNVEGNDSQKFDIIITPLKAGHLETPPLVFSSKSSGVDLVVRWKTSFHVTVLPCYSSTIENLQPF